MFLIRFICIRWVFLLLVWMCGVALASGCRSLRSQGTPSLEALQAVAGEVEVAEDDEDAFGDEYVLQPGDLIQIDVFREPELSGSFRLAPTGAIRHPLLGHVALSGLSVQMAEAHVRKRLAEDYLVNPRVILRVEEAASQHVLLMGEVRNPGVVSMGRGERMTLLQAIAKAGGFTEMASPNRVRVVRERDGNTETVRMRVGDILSGRGRQRDMILEPGDVVTVPEVRF